MTAAKKCCKNCGDDISHRAPQAKFCDETENPACHKSRQNGRQAKCRSGRPLPPRGWEIAPGPVLRPGGGVNAIVGHVQFSDDSIDVGPRKQDPTWLYLEGRHDEAEEVAAAARDRLLRSLGGFTDAVDVDDQAGDDDLPAEEDHGNRRGAEVVSLDDFRAARERPVEEVA